MVEEQNLGELPENDRYPQIDRVIIIKIDSYTFICSINTIIADSGCTNHYTSTCTPCNNKAKTHQGIHVHLPNGFTIKSTHTTLLNLPGLPLKAKTAHIFPKNAK